MKLDSKLMLELLKEEYDKRLSYYLSEIDTSADHSQSDHELVDNAKGLKVKDKAGFLYTIHDIVVEEEGTYALLLPPGKGDKEVVSSADEVLIDQMPSRDDYYDDEVRMLESESDEDNSKDDSKKRLRKQSHNGIVEPNKDAASKKSIKTDISAKPKEYEIVNGCLKVSIEELGKEFTL